MQLLEDTEPPMPDWISSGGGGGDDDPFAFMRNWPMAVTSDTQCKAVKGRKRMSDEEKAQTKRAREEDRSMLKEMRAFLQESQKKQKTVQQDITSINAEAGALQVHDKQSELIAFLGSTVAQQQAVIAALNIDLFNLGAKYHMDLIDADVRHRAEVDVLRDVVNEQKLQLKEMETLRDTLFAQKRQSDEMDVLPPVVAVVKKEPRKPTLKNQVAAVARVKHEPLVMLDLTLYTWQAVDDKSARCVDLYGFTAEQLVEIHAAVEAHKPAHVSKRGRKATHDYTHRLLVVLYYLVHYPTMKGIHERFAVSTSKAGELLVHMMGTVMPLLFEYSVRQLQQPIALFHYDAYFWAVQRPEDSVLAASLFDAEQGGHGVWIHCAHDAASGKAIAYRVCSQREPDATWLAPYTPNQQGGDATRAYETRLRNKFAIITSRFRGTLTECDREVRILLALTNLDLDYTNAVRARESLVLTDDSDTADFPLL